MAYPPLGAPRRSRRRIITIILVLIAVSVFAVSLALRSRSERRDSIEYLAAVKTITDQQVGIAGSLADMLTNLNDLERPDILERIADLDDEFQLLRGSLDGQVVTFAVAEVHGFFLVAMDSWGDGLAALDDAIVQIIDESDGADEGNRMLGEAFDSLRVGDRAYAGFIGAAALLEEDLRAPNYPGIRFVEPSEELVYDPAIIADRLRRSVRFEEDRDVSIVATTDPEPLGANGGLPVVPNSDFFVVEVVVTNQGNVQADLITVSVSLVEVSGDADVIERSEIVASLDPGQATTVRFDEIVLIPGGGYELRVDAEIADDDDLENNVWELDFIRGEL